MNDTIRNDYIKYRIERALEGLQDAKLLAQNKRWNACINRLYYSVFYGAIALLLQDKYTGSTHQGIRNQFHQRFIKEGIFDKKFGKLYSKLFDWRHKGDYGDLFNFTEEQILPLLPITEELLIKIRKEIKITL